MLIKLDIFSDKIRCFPHLTTICFVYYSLLFFYKPAIDRLLDMHIKSINSHPLRIILLIGYCFPHLANIETFLSILAHAYLERHLVTLMSLHMPVIRYQQNFYVQSFVYKKHIAKTSSFLKIF